MTRFLQTLRAGVLLGSALVLSSVAHAEILAIGIDRKFAYDDAGQRSALEPGHDEVVFFDLADPAKPLLIGSVPVENSIVGPPTNLAITPDQKIALIANALHSVKAVDGGWKPVAADELFVVDLGQRPPKLIKTLKVGSQPSGISIDRTGKLALVANRDGKSISVLAINGRDVSVTGTVPMMDSVVSVAISPDGRSAYAAKFGVHKVALLSIDAAGSVTYDGRDLPVGLYPWTVAVAPDGARALVTNIGVNAASDGNAKTVSVIDLKAEPTRVVQHLSVGDAPEGVTVSPNGRLAAATILKGSYDAPKGSWWRNPVGALSLFRLDAKGVRLTQNVDVGAFPEGVAFSANGRFLYVGNFASSSLSILALDGNGRVTGNSTMKLPGPAASLRIGSQ